MHTITNNSRGRHQVKTLDQGLVFLDPGDELTASLEPTYAKLMGRGLALAVSPAPEGAAAGLVKADPAATAPKAPSTAPEATQNGPAGDVSTLPADDDKPGWVKLAASKGIEVKKSWGVNRIKTEIEQLT